MWARKGPLVVAGLFGTASGIGQSARACADGLEHSGLNPLRVDLSEQFNQVDFKARKTNEFPSGKVGTLILHLNPPETVAGLRFLGLQKKRGWRVVGFWVHELSRVPAEWSDAQHYVSEIWTPSRFCADSFRTFDRQPVKVVPHRVVVPNDIGRTELLSDVPASAIVSLTMGDGRSSLDRKNIEGAIVAFLEALGDRRDCWLVVKCRNLTEHVGAIPQILKIAASHPRIKIIDHSISELEKWKLLARCDIFISLHRSEGFGLVMAEAMALGKAVVATNWSGNLEFMNTATARALAELIPPPYPGMARSEAM